MIPSGRDVTLVLCDASGEVVGGAGPFAVPTPWWQLVEDVVTAAAGAGLDVTVLRLLGGESATGWATSGGHTIYLAELHDGTHTVGDVAGDVDLGDHPLRQAWARPGGPAADLAWATEALEGAGHSLDGAPEQVRSWNLSSIWRLPVAGGPLWLKAVPPFSAHEGAMIDWVGACRPSLVPDLVAFDAGRVLLGHVSGEDQYDAGLEVALEMVDLLVDLQAPSTGAIDELLSLGVTDWRLPAFAPEVADCIERHAPELSSDERRALEACADDLGGRAVALAGCGLPDTLVHGDFHTGNVRRGAGTTTVLDWGDSGVGHPLLDIAELSLCLPAEDRPVLSAHAAARWSARLPGVDAARALELLAPIAGLRSAVLYERFLAAIEPTERCYHAADPLPSLRRAAASLLG